MDEMGRLIKNRKQWRKWIEAINPMLKGRWEEEGEEENIEYLLIK